jgi:glycine/D-amino acid oxidase-like deaminating enzyme
VVVLERKIVGWGASTRNAGIANTGLRQPAEVIFRRYGPAVGHVFWQSSIEAIDLLGEIIADDGIQCDFRREGHLWLARKARHFRKMEKRVQWFRRELGHRLSLVPAAELRSEIGSGVFYGGMADELSGGLHPAKFVYGLAAAVAQRGVQICEHTEVSRIQRQQRGYVVQTGRGLLRADDVILATGSQTERLDWRLRWRLLPLRQTCLVTERLPDSLQSSISPKGRVFLDSYSLPTHFRLTPDGRLLWCGHYDWRLRGNLVRDAKALQRDMLHVFPQIGHVRIANIWSGRISLALDWMPHIGRLDGMYYAGGSGGQGIHLAVYLGTEVAGLLCGQRSNSVFAGLRQWRVLPAWSGRSWVHPLITLYHRAWRLVT